MTKYLGLDLGGTNIKVAVIEKIDDKNLKIDDDILLSIDFGKFDFNVKNTILIKVFNDLTNLKL